MSSLSNAVTASWVDHERYFGPDRRFRSLFRIRERRKLDLSAPPPPLARALRKLKHRVLDARGHKGVGEFADLVLNVSILAELCEETEIQERLSALARRLYAHRGDDVRPMIYEALDRLRFKQDAVH